MTEMLETLNKAKVAAMKAKINVAESDRDAVELRLEVLRGLVGEVDRDSKEKKPRGVLAVLKSENAKRLDSERIYREAGENLRANRERAEAEIVAEFLPTEATKADLQSFIADFVRDNNLQGTGARSIGVVMAGLRGKFENFDSKLASQLVKSEIGAL